MWPADPGASRWPAKQASSLVPLGSPDFAEKALPAWKDVGANSLWVLRRDSCTRTTIAETSGPYSDPQGGRVLCVEKGARGLFQRKPIRDQ